MIFVTASLVESSCLNGRVDVDLLTCGVGLQKGNSMCPIVHRKMDDALKYPWVGATFYGNPEYTVEFVQKTLQKAISGYSKDLANTSFIYVFPDGKSAPWYSLLDQFQVVKTYPVGSKIVSCPSGSTYNTETLSPGGEEVGLDRVFINRTSLSVIVTKSKLTVPVINPLTLLHARLGHIKPSTMKVVVETGLHTRIHATEQHISMQLPTALCSICIQAKQLRPHFHAQDQTWMKDHVAPILVVTADMTGPLVKASCQGGYVLQFTCICTKWFWCKVLIMKMTL